MKCKIEDTSEFKPFKLEITIESEDDLLELWHRCNAPYINIKDYAISEGTFPCPEKSNIMKLWEILTIKYKEIKGLK